MIILKGTIIGDLTSPISETRSHPSKVIPSIVPNPVHGPQDLNDVFGIPLLLTLCDQQPVTHLLYHLDDPENYISTPHDLIPSLAPTNWAPTPPTIQYLERWSIDTSMVVVFVGELG